MKHGRGGAGVGGSALQCLQFPNIQPGNSNTVINKVILGHGLCTCHYWVPCSGQPCVGHVAREQHQK